MAAFLTRCMTDAISVEDAEGYCDETKALKALSKILVVKCRKGRPQLTVMNCSAKRRRPRPPKLMALGMNQLWPSIMIVGFTFCPGFGFGFDPCS